MSPDMDLKARWAAALIDFAEADAIERPGDELGHEDEVAEARAFLAQFKAQA